MKQPRLGLNDMYNRLGAIAGTRIASLLLGRELRPLAALRARDTLAVNSSDVRQGDEPGGTLDERI